MNLKKINTVDNVDVIENKDSGATSFFYKDGSSAGWSLSIKNPAKVAKVLSLAEELTTYERGWVSQVLKGRP